MVNISIGDIVVTESGLEGILLSRGWVITGGERKEVSSIEVKNKSSRFLNEIYSVTGRIYIKKDVDYIKSFKHMVGVASMCEGCEVYCGGSPFYLSILKCILRYLKFYDHNNNLLTYREYMMLYYPEFEFVWKEQISGN